MKYQLVVKNDHEDLVAEVNKLIDQGYKPLGGVVMSQVSEQGCNELKGESYLIVHTTFAQAMVKD